MNEKIILKINIELHQRNLKKLNILEIFKKITKKNDPSPSNLRGLIKGQYLFLYAVVLLSSGNLRFCNDTGHREAPPSLHYLITPISAWRWTRGKENSDIWTFCKLHSQILRSTCTARIETVTQRFCSPGRSKNFRHSKRHFKTGKHLQNIKKGCNYYDFFYFE